MITTKIMGNARDTFVNVVPPSPWEASRALRRVWYFDSIDCLPKEKDYFRTFIFGVLCVFIFRVCPLFIYTLRGYIYIYIYICVHIAKQRQWSAKEAVDMARCSGQQRGHRKRPWRDPLRDSPELEPPRVVFCCGCTQTHMHASACVRICAPHARICARRYKHICIYEWLGGCPSPVTGCTQTHMHASACVRICAHVRAYARVYI